MKAPTTVSEVLGMVNQLGKFSPHLAHLTQPLRELLSKKAGIPYINKHFRISRTS